MKTLKKTLASLAVAATVAVSGSAHAVLTNWYFDGNGVTGGFDGVQVGQYLDLNGQAFVANTFTPDTPNVANTPFTFQEAGTFLTTLADSTTALNANVSSTFTGTGFGTVGGTLTFNTDGVLTIGGGIGTFKLVSGSANLDAGTVLPNGAVSLIFQATALSAGYFFDSAMTDLSTLNPIDVLLGFVTTNAIPIGTGEALTAGPVGGAALQTLYNATFNPDVADPIIDQQHFLRLSNNGQFQIATIPEPGSLALLGLGALGLFALRRRNTN